MSPLRNGGTERAAKTARALRSRLASRAQQARRRLSTTFSREGLRELFSTRSFRSGSFTALACVAVVALAALAVFAVEQLPASMRLIDLSQEQPTSLSDSTREYLAELDEDVIIYLIAPEGEEDDYTQILLENYDDASDRVSVVQKDPDLYPTFTRTYTDEELASGSLIITCGDDSRIVSAAELYTVNYSTYSYEFAGEEAVTSAITALTTDDLPRIYLTQGHGESELPASVQSDLETANFEIESLNLLSEETVPDDADAVVAYAPTSDISTDEKDKLLAYLEEDGSLILITAYDREDTPNLDEVMDTYGMASEDGVVIEGDMTHMIAGLPYYLLPDVSSTEATEDTAADNLYVLMPLAHGISETESHRSSLSVTSILTTSTNAYLKTQIDTAETLEYEEGDVSGQTSVGMISTEAVDGNEARVAWLSTPYFLYDEMDMTVGGSNTALFLDLVAWATDAETPGAELAGKGLGYSYITVDASTASTLSVLLIGVVPAGVLIAGFVVWRRRKAV